jgi:hypothetical protein
MRRQYQNLGAPHHVFQPGSRTVQEASIAGQDPLVHQQDLRADGGGQRERQADHHARGVDAHRQVDKVAKVRKAPNVVGQASQRGARQSVVQAAQGNVLPPS